MGGCSRRVQTAWPCLGSAVERSWSALGGPSGSESSRLHGFVGPPFPAYIARFSATAGCHFSGGLIASPLIGGCG